MQPRTKPQALAGQFQRGSRKIYNSLLILLHLMDVIAPEHSWRKNLIHLLNKSPLNLRTMGFSANWKEKEIWQNTVAEH